MHDQSISFRFAQTIVVAIASILAGNVLKWLWLLAAPFVHWLIGGVLIAWLIFWALWAAFYWKRSRNFDSPEWYPWLNLLISVIGLCYGFWMTGSS